jgi:histidine kinase/DNA gyrase B/HSP90-like ATPase
MEESNSNQLFVKSHVARDLLQNAGLFKTDKLVVWEYVSNGLQYVDPGINPIVRVFLDGKSKRITVSDNGRGMDWTGLQNFFVMHGENIDRKEGRPGRGRFGTGKSAAFGIADILRISTQRKGKRSRVEISRVDVEKMSSEDPIPVKVIEREAPCSEQNGTLIEIEGVRLKSLDQAGVIRYIERHLAKWPKNTSVYVNNHECEFAEPPISKEFQFRSEGEFEKFLGDALLVVRVSKSPLEEDFRGVSIFANGVWHETTLAGSEGRDMSQFIFGEIDVPKLDEDRSPIAPFDVSRSMKLNENNELVQAIYAFVGLRIEEVRRKLVEEEKERKTGEDAKKLAEQASEIARLINQDFDAFRLRVAKVKAKAAGGSDLIQAPDQGKQTDNDDLLFGSELPAVVLAPKGGPGHGNGTQGQGGTPPNQGPEVTPGPTDAANMGRKGVEAVSSRRPRGGFQVSFRNLGAESQRAAYVRDERTILINLDHPQLVAARGDGSIDEPVFRKLAYEVAFSEYALSLSSELAAHDELMDPMDAIWEIRETLNRIARQGASLFHS